jgi:hypothetical protein
METGSRSDIVFRDGLSWGSFLRVPDGQSTYSVEFAVAQNFLSASSFLNSGIFLFMSLEGLRFVPIHVSGRNHSYELLPDGEDYKQPPANTCLSEDVVSLLTFRMANIATHHERLMKKHILGFLRSHLVAFPILVDIGVVPAKSGAIVQRIPCRHTLSIRLSYTRTGMSNRTRSRQASRIACMSKSAS